MIHAPRVVGGLLAPALLVGLLAACPGESPRCAALPTAVELTLTDDALTPSNPAVCRGMDVTLTVHSEVDGVFHIHGYDEQVPATPVSAGEVTELTFSAARSGQFPIELHAKTDAQGAQLGIFTVHEP